MVYSQQSLVDKNLDSESISLDTISPALIQSCSTLKDTSEIILEEKLREKQEKLDQRDEDFYPKKSKNSNILNNVKKRKLPCDCLFCACTISSIGKEITW